MAEINRVVTIAKQHCRQFIPLARDNNESLAQNTARKTQHFFQLDYTLAIYTEAAVN